MQFITVHSAPGEPIGQHAFENCSSLEAIFLPPTVTKIDSKPFCKCKSLRTINFLDTVAVQYLGYNVIPDSGQHFGYYIVAGCDDLLTDEAKSHVSHGDKFHHWLRNRYNPLHNLCWDPSVKAYNIQKYIQEHCDNKERAGTHD